MSGHAIAATMMKMSGLMALGKTLVVIIALILTLCVPTANAKHHHRHSHVLACAAMVNAPCQAKLKIRSIGGGIAVPTYIYQGK